MKRRLGARWILLGLACLALSGFAPGQETLPPLRWGADCDGGVPYVFKDPEDPTKIIGADWDLKLALEKELGRKIEFVQYQFDSLLSGLERGDLDFVMNGMEITPENLRRAAFTKPYYLYQLQLVVKSGERRFQTLEEAKAADLVIGSLQDSAADRLLKAREIRQVSYPDQLGPFLELEKNERIQGVLLDVPIALYYAAPDPGLPYTQCARPGAFQFAGPPFAEGYYGIAVHPKNTKLLEQLNAAIANLRASGELKRIMEKWQLWNMDQYRIYDADPDIQPAPQGIPFFKYIGLLLEGAAVTVGLTFASMALAILLGLPLALMRLYGATPVRWLAIVYIEFFRGIPVLLVLYFLYFGLPELAPGINLAAWQAAILGFGLNYAAYEAEIYRAGIGSISVGQWEAAASLGMSGKQTFGRIILPQAIRVILPPMTNDLVALFKDTSVVSIIAVVELSKQYQILTKSGGGYLEIGLTTAALYLIMSVPLGYLSRYLEQRWGAK